MRQGEVEYEFDEGAVSHHPPKVQEAGGWGEFADRIIEQESIDMIVGEILDALRWLERRHGQAAVAEALRRVLITAGAPQS
jgi:hypothetical protein